jgi:uncharacterized YigZ family protein
MVWYKTIVQPGISNHRVLGSRHLGYCFEIKDESEAQRIIKEFRLKYHDATHVCFAYRIGVEGGLHKCSDDGEPSGTAGRPILGAILSAQLTQVLVIVVRYYGGTKLGTSGLIQAYKTAASLSLENAGAILKEAKITFKIRCSYNQMPFVLTELKSIQAEKYSIVQEDWVVLIYQINQGKYADLEQKIRALDNALIEIIAE